MAFFSMPQGYILMNPWLKIFLSKISLTLTNFGVYYLLLLTTIFNKLPSTFY